MSRMKWDRHRPESVPFYAAETYGIRNPPRERARKPPPAPPRRKKPRFEVIRSHNWRPVSAPKDRPTLMCMACGETKVYRFREGFTLQQVDGSRSSICKPRTAEARGEVPSKHDPRKCRKCGSWVNQKFGTCSNRACR